jgi:hypothetical protein
MFHVSEYWDPWRGRVRWSAWRNEPAEVVPRYVDKSTAYRPIQQRPRDGTVIRHRTGGLRGAS